MSVKYNVVERGKPGSPETPKKYYPSIQASGRVTLRQLSQAVSQMSTVSSADTMAVLEALLTVIPQELSRGNIVELGDFGNFWLRTSTEGADTSRSRAHGTNCGRPAALQRGQGIQEGAGYHRVCEDL